jgi:hypothetical protein
VSGETVATGALSSGGREGTVTIPLIHARPKAVSVRVCLRIGGTHTIVIGGEGIPLNPGSEQIDGVKQPGRIGLMYFRHGEESWWQLLPTLSTRFGVGKAPIFGDWTFPVMALMLLGAWVATVRLLSRELR